MGPFLFALSGITAIIFLNSLSQRVGDLVGKGLPWTVIVEFLVLSLPHVIALALPMAVLVAVLYAFNDLAASNEITAFAAGGIRPRQMMAPVVGMGVVAATVMFYFNDKVLPESNHALKNLILDISRKSPTLEMREQVVNELRPGGGSDLYFLTADRIDHESATLGNVAIFDANDPLRHRTTYAARGEMAFNAARTDLYLTLYDGVVHEAQADREGGFQRLFFEQQVIPLRGVGNELERRLGGSDRSDREMSIALLSENAHQRQAELDSVRTENRTDAMRAVLVALDQPSGTDSTGAFTEADIGGWRVRSTSSARGTRWCRRSRPRPGLEQQGRALSNRRSTASTSRSTRSSRSRSHASCSRSSGRRLRCVSRAAASGWSSRRPRSSSRSTGSG